MFKRIAYITILGIVSGTLFQNCGSRKLSTGLEITSNLPSLTNPKSEMNPPTIEDVFSGEARFQSIAESEEIELNFTTAVTGGIYDQKMPIFFNSNDGFWYTITRGQLADTKNFNVFLLRSTDAIHFTQVGDAIFNSRKSSMMIYDAHISIDISTTPNTYVMSIECAVVAGNQNPYGASVCVSTSQTPWVPDSWTDPKLIIRNDGSKSASTAVVLIDNGQYYLKWTLVDDGSNIWNVGTESTSSWAAKIMNFSDYKGLSTQAGQLLIGVSQDTHCKNSWDCNNIDIQDWKKIKNTYYAVYNGANYYRCTRKDDGYMANIFGNDYDYLNFTSEWALAIRKSDTALGDYSSSTGPLIAADRKDTCGISYPVLNQVGNDWYMYYAYYPADNLKNGKVNQIMRSKLIRSSGTKSILSVTPLSPVFASQPYPAIKSCDLNELSMKGVTNESKVNYMYCLILNRLPDTTGFGTLTNNLNQGTMTTITALNFLFSSLEFQNLYSVSTLSNSQYIHLIYGQLLHRSPDSAGLELHLRLLNSAQITRENMFKNFISSAEFNNNNFILR